MRTINQYYGKAILSAFIASTVTALAYLTWRTLAPANDISMDMIYWMGAVFGRPGDMVIGWLAHFILGSVIGGALFAWISPHLFGRLWMRGALFGVIVWFAMMAVALPTTDAGMFGKNYSPELPTTIFMLKLIYGIVMGAVYGKLLEEQSKPTSERIGGVNENIDRHSA